MINWKYFGTIEITDNPFDNHYLPDTQLERCQLVYFAHVGRLLIRPQRKDQGSKISEIHIRAGKICETISYKRFPRFWETTVEDDNLTELEDL